MSADVQAYVDAVPADRREAFDAVRAVINEHVPDGFEEMLEFGMVTWAVPLAHFSKTYNKRPLGTIALANQKNHLAVYVMGLYAEEGGEAWFRSAWEATGTKLDMGTSCVRFRSLEDVALDVLAAAVRRTSVDDLIAAHERAYRR